MNKLSVGDWVRCNRGSAPYRITDIKPRTAPLYAPAQFLVTDKPTGPGEIWLLQRDIYGVAS